MAVVGSFSSRSMRREAAHDDTRQVPRLFLLRHILANKAVCLACANETTRCDDASRCPPHSPLPSLGLRQRKPCSKRHGVSPYPDFHVAAQPQRRETAQPSSPLRRTTYQGSLLGCLPLPSDTSAVEIALR